MQIDLYSDTVCPWCRIGWQHLKLALASWQGEPVTVNHHPFFLNPDVPPEGYDFLPYMTAKFQGRITPEAAFAAPSDAGKRVGLTFRFDLVGKAPNTLLSHRLIALTPEAQRDTIVEAVFDAYFEHGRDIGQLDVLADIAAETSLDRAATHAALSRHVALAEVLADVQRAQQLGIQGVPFFVLDNRFAFSGAQPPEVMLRAMQQTVDQRQTAPTGR